MHLFEQDQHISGCAIVDENRLPIGYIDRNNFVTRVSGLYGRALYDNRPAETLATQNYRIVSIDREIGEEIGFEPGGSELNRQTGLIVVDEEGCYVGLTHAFAITQALLKDNHSLVEELKREIEVRQAAEQAVRDMADRDELTGVFNRRRFMNELKERFESKAATLLVYIDLDRFKQVNDTYGHSAGDFVLTTVAARLTEIAGGGLLARIGGDEFAMIDDAIEDRGLLKTRLLQIEQAVTKPIKRANGWLDVGTSMGAAQYPADFDSAFALIDGADHTMMAAKASGGGFKIHADEAGHSSDQSMKA